MVESSVTMPETCRSVRMPLRMPTETSRLMIGRKNEDSRSMTALTPRWNALGVFSGACVVVTVSLLSGASCQTLAYI